MFYHFLAPEGGPNPTWEENSTEKKTDLDEMPHYHLGLHCLPKFPVFKGLMMLLFEPNEQDTLPWVSRFPPSNTCYTRFSNLIAFPPGDNLPLDSLPVQSPQQKVLRLHLV